MQLTNCYCWLLCLRKHQRVCFCYVQFVSTQSTNKNHRWSMNRFKKKLRNQPPERVEGGRFPSVCVKAPTNARSSSRRTSSSTNHQIKGATKINFHLSSSRRLIMLQKSSSAHRVRAYYHSFLPVQMECHTNGSHPFSKAKIQVEFRWFVYCSN